MHVYKVRRRKDHRGVDLISDALPFGRLWYGEPNATDNAIDYARFFSRSHDAVIRVYDAAGNVIETHEHGRVQRAEALLVTARHEPERSVVSINRLHWDSVRHGPDTGVPSDRNCNRESLHSDVVSL